MLWDKNVLGMEQLSGEGDERDGEDQEFAAWMQEQDDAQKLLRLRVARLKDQMKQTSAKVAEARNLVAQIGADLREAS